MLKVTSESSSSEVVLDSVEDSEESEAEDFGRLSEADSSVTASVEEDGGDPRLEAFDTEL